MFKGWLLDQIDGKLASNFGEISSQDLPSGDVTLRVLYSTLNYKDALAMTGKAPVVRSFPMVPGIDFVGEVVESRSEQWKEGDLAILNGWGVGEAHWGGLAEFARVKSEWLIALPPAMKPKQAMSLGTAGYTAMLSVMALQAQGVKPNDGEVLVTGGNGGVGSIAIMLLSTLGYCVVASTGRLSEKEYLLSLGAVDVIHREALSNAGKPLAKERWGAAIDSVGSHTLANVCASLRYGGVVTACGLAQGFDFPATVMPFILRGIRLIGIDSVHASLEKRTNAWNELAEIIDMTVLEKNTQDVSLSECAVVANDLLAGKIRGRVVVNCQQ